MGAIWVVVADSSLANIYAAPKKYAPLDEVKTISNPAGRLKVQELTSDLPGRTFDRYGQGRHAMGQTVGPKQQAILRFAHEIGEYLESSRTQRKFAELMLVAPPEFLGVLRKSLSNDCRDVISVELAKDLVSQDKRKLRDYLTKHL